MACSGASMRGPLRSSLTSGERFGRPSTTAVRRRGVANVLISPNSSPAALSLSPSRRARSSRARVCIRAGISSENSSSRSSSMGAPARFGLEPRGAARFGEITNAQDISLALGHGDNAAGIEQIEDVRGLDRLIVGGQHHEMALAPISFGEQRFALGFGIAKILEQLGCVGMLEIEAGIFLLALQEYVAIGDLVVALAAIEVEVVDIVDALHIHGQALQPVGQLAGDGIAVEAADLLEVSELRHLHAVAPHLPAEPPGAERRALPIVLDEANVVILRVDADGVETLQVELLDIARRRLQDHLKLVIMLEPVGVLTVTAILGTARGLHVSRAPRLWAQRAQSGRRVKRPRPHFHVVGLEDDAAAVGPEALKPEDQVLEGRHVMLLAGFGHRNWGVPKNLGEGRRTLMQFPTKLNRHARPCAGHPRISIKASKTWMATRVRLRRPGRRLRQARP